MRLVIQSWKHLNPLICFKPLLSICPAATGRATHCSQQATRHYINLHKTEQTEWHTVRESVKNDTATVCAVHLQGHSRARNRKETEWAWTEPSPFTQQGCSFYSHILYLQHFASMEKLQTVKFSAALIGTSFRTRFLLVATDVISWQRASKSLIQRLSLIWTAKIQSVYTVRLGNKVKCNITFIIHYVYFTYVIVAVTLQFLQISAGWGSLRAATLGNLHLAIPHTAPLILSYLLLPLLIHKSS